MKIHMIFILFCHFFFYLRYNVYNSILFINYYNMKKIILATLAWSVLFANWVFADEKIALTTEGAPQYYVDSISENGQLIMNNDIIIRNNYIEPDNEYNNVNYFTSKIKTENIVIPKDIKDKAKKIYFLVEEGNNPIFYKEMISADSGGAIGTVKTEYNYKIVDFNENLKEYTFKNADLVKDFTKDEFKSVTITLMAEFSNGEKLAISNPAYVYISNKEEVLNQLLMKKNPDNYYYSYYNSENLENYLKKISELKTRSVYKATLIKADKTIVTLTKQNNETIKTLLSNLKVEADFAKNLDKYEVYNETRSLLQGLSIAVKNQLQNIKAFDAIDSILK